VVSARQALCVRGRAAPRGRRGGSRELGRKRGREEEEKEEVEEAVC